MGYPRNLGFRIANYNLARSISYQEAYRFQFWESLSIIIALCCKYYSRNHQESNVFANVIAEQRCMGLLAISNLIMIDMAKLNELAEGRSSKKEFEQ